MEEQRPLRVAVAHEWLVRYAGSERVAAELLAAFDVRRLLTTVVRPAALPEALRSASPSFLQRLPGATEHHEWLLPLMPLAWRLREPIEGVDAVVSSSHACAKAVRAAPGIPHVSYCHTPMRYAWDFAAEATRFPRAARPAARVAMAAFRRWDRGTAGNVTRFVANSSAVAQRVRRAYGREAEVVFPPVRTDFFTPDGAAPRRRFLYVGRLVAYKRPDLVVDAFRGLDAELVVVGEGQMREQLIRDAPPNVAFESDVDDEGLRRLYREAVAFVYPADEDFGIVMAEAQACGTPVVALGRGGAVDIVEHGVTGWLLDEQEARRLREVLRIAARDELDRAAIARSAERFSATRFREEMRRIVAETVADPTPR